MFYDATSFNKDLGNWNTGSVSGMSYMFLHAISFNQNIGNWNTDSVQNMEHMFHGATSFNQNLGSWQLNAMVDVSSMFDSSGIDCLNYSNTLIGWSNNNRTPSGRRLGAANLLYESTAIPKRNFLIYSKGWTFMGDALSTEACYPVLFSSCSIRPNPVKEQANISIISEIAQEASICVYNCLGSIVFKDKFHLHSGANSYKIITKSWSNGIYTTYIQMTSMTFINRLVVSN